MRMDDEIDENDVDGDDDENDNKTGDEMQYKHSENDINLNLDLNDNHDDGHILQICVTPAKMHRIRAHSDVDTNDNVNGNDDGNESGTENEVEAVMTVTTPSVNCDPLEVQCSNLSDGSNDDGNQTDISNMSLTPR